MNSSSEDPLSWHKLADYIQEVEAAWPDFLQRLSWWNLKLYLINRRGGLKYKLKADVVIDHPEGRFTTAMTPEQWRKACILAFVA